MATSPKRYKQRVSPTGAIVVARIPYLPSNIASDLLAAPNWRDALRDVLKSVPEIQTALRIASRSLYASLLPWLDGARVDDKALLKALMYVMRMSSRATPFGQFAAIGGVDVADSTTLHVKGDAFQSTSRPDMAWLSSWVKDVESELNSRNALPLVLNDLVLHRGDRIWILEPANVEEARKGFTEFRRSVIDRTDGVNFVLRSPLPMTAEQLADALSGEFAVPLDRCLSLIKTLRDVGLLRSALVPIPMGDVFERMRSVFDASSHAIAVADVRESLRMFDEKPIEHRRADDVDQVETQLLEVKASNRSPIQVDMAVNFSGTLGRRILDDVARLGDIALRIAGERRPLDALRERFAALYEGTDAVVPLLELADPEFGLGKLHSGDTSSLSFAQQHWLTNAAIGAIRDGKREIELSTSDIDTLFPKPRDDERLPPSVEIGFTLHSDCVEAVEAGDYLIAPFSLMTDRAGRSLGRFLHVLDDSIARRLQEFLEETTAVDGAVPVELVFTPPDPRSMNVCIRPRLLKYELQVGLDDAGAARLDLSQLYVGLDGGRFYLWSSQLGRRLEIHQTHVLGVGTNVPSLLTFLIALQADGMRYPSTFLWGQASDFPYLPRVRVGRIVLSPARWCFDLAEFRTAVTAAAYLADFKKRWNVPALVTLTEGDNCLRIDLDHETAVPILSRIPERTRYAMLVESQDSPRGLWLSSPHGRHVCEFVASLKVQNATTPRHSVRPCLQVSAIERCLTPDSEWIYLKLYCAPNDLDGVLRRWRPLLEAEEWPASSLIANWFFIRYSVPAHHLRLRLKANVGKSGQLRDRALSIAGELIREQRVSTYSVDTYHREIERYGGRDAIEFCERIFEIDSRHWLKLIAEGSPRNDDVFEQSCISCVELIQCLYPGESLEEWLRFSQIRAKLSSSERDLVKRIIRRMSNADRRLSAYADLLPEVHGLQRLERAGRLAKTFADIVSSIVHMHFNRFGTGGRELRGRAIVNASLQAFKHVGGAVAVEIA